MKKLLLLLLIAGFTSCDPGDTREDFLIDEAPEIVESDEKSPSSGKSVGWVETEGEYQNVYYYNTSYPDFHFSVQETNHRGWVARVWRTFDGILSGSYPVIDGDPDNYEGFSGWYDPSNNDNTMDAAISIGERIVLDLYSDSPIITFREETTTSATSEAKWFSQDINGDGDIFDYGFRTRDVTYIDYLGVWISQWDFGNVITITRDFDEEVIIDWESPRLNISIDPSNSENIESVEYLNGNITEIRVPQGQQYTLLANAVDDGHIVSYRWTDNGVDFPSRTTEWTHSHGNAAVNDGIHEISVEVIDEDGLFARASVIVNVQFPREANTPSEALRLFDRLDVEGYMITINGTEYTRGPGRTKNIRTQNYSSNTGHQIVGVKDARGWNHFYVQGPGWRGDSRVFWPGSDPIQAFGDALEYAESIN